MRGGDGLAIVAGRGDLPRLLAERQAAGGKTYRVVQFEGVDLDWTGGHPVIPAIYEKPGRLFSALRAAGCGRVVFAGGISRPDLKPLRFDFKMLKLAPMLLSKIRAGDSTTLQAVVWIFEAEGLEVVGAHDLMPEILVQKGVLGTVTPSDRDYRDMERAMRIVQAMAVADVGQATVVARGICLGVESIQGTDVMLDFVAATRTDRSGPAKSGVLFKAPKAGQDWRVDLPAIGGTTIQNAAKAGLAGLALQAGGVMLLGREKVIASANEHGLFLYGYDVPR